MRFADLLGLALSALWQQKLRTLLTLLGVTFAAFVLFASFSTHQGVQEAIGREMRKHDQLRKIVVHQEYGARAADIPPAALEIQGNMSAAKRERLRQAVIRRWPQKHGYRPPVPLTAERIRQIGKLEHVERVTPLIHGVGWAVFDGKEEQAASAAGHALDPRLRARLVAGELFPDPDARQVAVSEYLLYLWGIADDADVARVLGRKVRLEFRSSPRQTGFFLHLVKPNEAPLTRADEELLAKLRNQLPTTLPKSDLSASERAALQKLLQTSADPESRAEATFAEEFTIAGVIRLPDERDERFSYYDITDQFGDVYLPARTAEDLFTRMPHHQAHGFDRAVVVADDDRNVKEIVRRIETMGFQCDAPIRFIEKERLMFRLIFAGMIAVACVALLVAALGIVNTMLMSVLERTREVGIMKAVGAAEGQIQLIFLIEGALIGLVGGGLGVFLSWLASFPGDAWVRGMVAREFKVTLEESLFIFPTWLTAGVVLFSALVTTVAAVYPARRAARVNTVAALRHD